jgi:hypothetical protein
MTRQRPALAGPCTTGESAFDTPEGDMASEHRHAKGVGGSGLAREVHRGPPQ